MPLSLANGGVGGVLSFNVTFTMQITVMLYTDDDICKLQIL